MSKENIHEDWHSRNRQPTTTKTSGNLTYSGKYNPEWNSTTKKIQSNKHDILLGKRSKSFPHILGKSKEKPGELCHKTPPNMAPQIYATKIFETKKWHKNYKDRPTGTRRGSAGTTNPGVT